MNDIKISVVVPVYNVEAYVGKCLRSIMNQDYKNFEVLVVDDGSTDKSSEIIKKIAEEDNRFKILTKENGGLASARNFAFDRIKGDYIAFVDSDDYLEPNYLSVLLDGMENNDVQISMCGYIFESEEGEEIYRIEKENEVLSREDIIKKMYIPMNRSWGSFSWNKMFCADIIRENNLRYDESLVIFEDIFFWYEYLKYVKKGYFNTKGVYHYLNRKTSLINSIKGIKAEKKWTEYTVAFDKMLEDSKDSDDLYYKQTLSMKWIHGCTAIRAMAAMKLRNHPRYKAERKFLKKHFISQIINKDLPLGKRMGAFLTLLMPRTAYNIWVKKNGK